MLPILEGIIARRVLVNFRVDPAVARPLVPAPLRVATHRGFAIVGVCLIRLENLWPRGFPALFNLSCENMAHRVAIQFPTREGWKDGVFIWRRETNQPLMQLLGGRLFPGVHQAAEFRVQESFEDLEMDVRTKHGEADVSLRMEISDLWKSTPAFYTFEEVSEFFRRGDCGFSCGLGGNRFEGMQLRTLRWEMTPVSVTDLHAAFYENQSRFPRGSVEFDSALLMRRLPHEWHSIAGAEELLQSWEDNDQ